MAPRVEERRGVDDTVVAEEEQRDGVDLEVQVRRRPLRVAGVAHEAEDGAGLDARPVDREGRERGEVRVVELVALTVAQPEPVASDVVPADREHRPVGAGEHGCAKGREDVVAVVPVAGDIAAEGAEGVRERDLRPVHREDVAAGGQLRLQALGNPPQ